MDAWPKYKFRKLGFLNYWHLHHDALSSSSYLILCVCDFQYLPTNHHSCSKIISSSNNQVKWWAWKTISSPRCDECLQHGLLVQYLPNLHMNQTSMFIWLFWKGFIINPKSLNPPSMDPSNTWCECFGPIVPFFQDQYWCPIFNGLWTNPYFSIQCLDFGKRFPLMHYYVFNFMSSWKW
jgi:hypothetical protein